jgi:hypothetical protein
MVHNARKMHQISAYCNARTILAQVVGERLPTGIHGPSKKRAGSI